MVTISEIEKWRVDHRLTKKELASRLSITYTFLVDILNGKRELSAATAAKFEVLRGEMARECRYDEVRAYACMLTRTQVTDWMSERGISRKQLAEELDTNYNALCSVLSGARPMSAGLSARIERLMQQRRNLVYVVPPEWEPLLKTWAATAGISPEEMLTRLLADAFKLDR